MAGESAQRIYERQRAKRRDCLRRSWRFIGVAAIVAFLVGWLVSVAMTSAALSIIESVGLTVASGLRIHLPPLWVSLALGSALALRAVTILLAPPQSEVAWRKGAEGERIVGSTLDGLAADGIQVLHDRKIPGSQANIDHIAITPAGVFTIDAKRYTGRLEVRGRGREIWIKGRNRSKLLEQGHRQARTVATVLDRVRITPALCFVDTDLPWLAPKQVAGVALMTPRKLRKRLLAAAGPPLTPAQQSAIVAALDSVLLPADLPSRRRATEPGNERRHTRPPAAVPFLRRTSPSAPPAADLSTPPQCGRCGERMVVRERRSDGERFFGCSDFPHCRQTQPFRELRPPRT